jgi:hypothetical protein
VRTLSTARAEIAPALGAVAHHCDTTPERRSPDHLAMTGAAVQANVCRRDLLGGLLHEYYQAAA